MEFFRNTSMHGFRYLADRKINWLHKYAEIIDISLPPSPNNSQQFNCVCNYHFLVCRSVLISPQIGAGRVPNSVHRLVRGSHSAGLGCVQFKSNLCEARLERLSSVASTVPRSGNLSQ